MVPLTSGRGCRRRAVGRGRDRTVAEEQRERGDGAEAEPDREEARAGRRRALVVADEIVIDVVAIDAVHEAPVRGVVDVVAGDVPDRAHRPPRGVTGRRGCIGRDRRRGGVVLRGRGDERRRAAARALDERARAGQDEPLVGALDDLSVLESGLERVERARRLVGREPHERDDRTALAVEPDRVALGVHVEPVLDGEGREHQLPLTVQPSVYARVDTGADDDVDAVHARDLLEHASASGASDRKPELDVPRAAVPRPRPSSVRDSVASVVNARPTASARGVVVEREGGSSPEIGSGAFPRSSFPDASRCPHRRARAYATRRAGGTSLRQTRVPCRIRGRHRRDASFIRRRVSDTPASYHSAHRRPSRSSPMPTPLSLVCRAPTFRRDV